MTLSPWHGRSVFVTGHTGFKGSWLSLWLARRGARVHGYSLPAPTEPALFVEARVAECLVSHTLGDVRDADAVAAAVRAARPEVVFHLAAQPLVRRSYREPVETVAINVLGTVNVLEAARRCDSIRAVVNVTTDKCYENREWLWGYRENEALGGRDPYAASKACAEIVTTAWRDSFLREAGVALASARAGNVIGGGDWAEDRLLPDFFRAADAGSMLTVRHPEAVRPWQHVLEPVSGYMTLALALLGDAEHASAWNFGPDDADAQPVSAVLDQLCRVVPGAGWRHEEDHRLHEAGLLKLDSSKARKVLGWRPRWRLSRALEQTAGWHLAWRSGADARELVLDQIESYEATLAA